MEFNWAMWYWAAGILIGFLPLEIYAARSTPGKNDTFSEFIWWVFGVKPKRFLVCTGELDGYETYDYVIRKVKYARFRRAVLLGMCLSLTFHFVLAATVVPVIIFGILSGIIMLYAFIYERA